MDALTFLATSPSYSSAFPPLHSFPWTNSPQTKRHGHHPHSPGPSLQHSLAPPKYPSYLKQTHYGELALEQYNYIQSKHSKQWAHTTSSWKTNPPPAPTSPPSLHEQFLDSLDLRLPSVWNPKDKSRHIEVEPNGLDLIYNGPGKNESHAASVRANFPMRRQCGIYYFEFTVISKGEDGYIGIGFCSSQNELDRLPGWDPDSWGYHGDDGHSFAGSGIGKTFGPCFTTGDVIGCGVNFAKKTAFYTKNGAFLGVAFENLDTSIDLYPCVGLRTPGEHVLVNFGDEPFAFDIIQYVTNQTQDIWNDILHTPIPEPPSETNTARSSDTMLDQLVLTYLIHHGYTDTAKSLVANAQYAATKHLPLSYTGDAETDDVREREKEESDMQKRQAIRAAVITGDVDLAMELTERYFPGVLDGDTVDQDISLDLKCHKFIEMIRECNEQEVQRGRLRSDDNDSLLSCDDHMSLCSNRSRSNSSVISDSLDHAEDRQSRHAAIPITISPSASSTPIPAPGRRRSYASIAASISPSSHPNQQSMSASLSSYFDSEPMMIDEDRGRRLSHEDIHRRPNVWTKRRSNSNSSIGSLHNLRSHSNGMLSYDQILEEDENLTSASSTTSSMMKKAMKFGHQLQDEFRHDPRPHIRTKLMDVFSLLAYPDPMSSPVAHLLDISGRDALATKLNAAILGKLFRTCVSIRACR
ncbi:uncharacterized protein BYT42DRAFT_202909 [Radiomyces spectabilis]|uniref:uncharacterized protein n=1 Tax=Radiomyces spectabilis TaxID=64574 RepID=UPI00221EE2A5|nr:uncharacterized protein BYT42DRAFT_202909 [Radiomyces spectabilis]KAI8391650.1 hypothetical protein BYT42DRAFT_202909 [Radiomyces spectabilis]